MPIFFFFAGGVRRGVGDGGVKVSPHPKFLRGWEVKCHLPHPKSFCRAKISVVFWFRARFPFFECILEYSFFVEDFRYENAQVFLLAPSSLAN